MKYRFSLGRAVAALLLLALTPVAAQAQTSSVGIGTAAPDASAALDITSTSKGLLPPRLTVAQRDAIASPAAGLTIFNTSTNRLNTWNGSSWDQALSVTEAPVSYAVQTYTVPGQYSYMVPPGITSLNVSVSGASGGDAIQFGTTTVAYSGGYGGRASATLTVMPGELLVLNVGGAGASNAPGSNGLGGYNGGGNSGIGSGCSECSGAGGGGASDIRRGTTYLVVAGGGGGGGGSTGPYTRGGNGGFGGYPAGTSSAQGSGPQGGGGTQTAGGSGFGPGTMGQGGSVSGGIGGGGGGGYYGGGAATSGGGGGSSYVTPAGNGSYGTASPRGDGSITITPGVFTPIAISNMPGDNLGNHTATQNLNLGFSQLVGNGGATGLAISANGNVGIGTTIPGQKLEVAGNVLISGSGNGLQFPDGTTQRTAVAPANLTGDITSTGNATSYAAVVPATKGGAGMVSGILKANGNGTVSQAVAGTDYAPATGSSGYIQNNSGTQQVAGFNISGNGYVGGNVGVGLSIPTQRLDVEGGILARSNGAITNQGAHLQWNRSGGDGETWLLNQRGGGGGGMRFGAATTSNTTTEWARFDGSGNLGLGTPNPNYKLEVNGTALINSGYDLLIRDIQHGLGWYGAGKPWGSATPDGPVLYGYTGGILGTRDGGTTAVLAWNKSGRVGIGTTDPQARLQVNGVALFGEGTLPTTGNATGLGWNSVRPGLGETELYNYRGSGAGGFRFYSVGGTGAPVAGNQVASINAAGVYSALSDRRVKTNITPLGQGLRTVLALRPVSYDFHPSRQLKDGVVTFLPDDQPVRALGFVAQDLYQVVPEAVEKPKDDKKEFYTVSYTTLVPVLTQAIQEQQAQIEELKKQNAALQTQTKALEARAATAEAKAATTEADHASLLTLQAQLARLLGEGTQARK